MAKIILEKLDIESLIKEKYYTISIDGIPDDLEVVIKVDQIVTKATQPVTPAPQPPKAAVVIDGNGNIDAEKSGMTSKPREKTVPGNAMGRIRGKLPVF